MKKLFLATALSLYSTAALAGYGQDGKVYTRFDLGFGVQDLKQELTGTNFTTGGKKQGRGAVITAGMGYYLLDEFRLELSFLVERGAKAKVNEKASNSDQYTLRGRERTLGGFFNTYYDVLNYSNMAPFISVGAGMVRQDFESRVSNITAGTPTTRVQKGHFTYALAIGAGFAYHLASNLDVDMTFRHFRTRKEHFHLVDSISGTDIMATGGPVNIISLGLRTTF